MSYTFEIKERERRRDFYKFDVTVWDPDGKLLDDDGSVSKFQSDSWFASPTVGAASLRQAKRKLRKIIRENKKWNAKLAAGYEPKLIVGETDG